MESIYNLVLKLRKSLIEANNHNYMKDNWISEIDIHKIREFIKYTNDDKINKERFIFLETIHDFSGIYSYFFFENYIDDSDLYRYVREIFDPLLNYLMQNNYEIEMKRIVVNQSVETFYSDIYLKLESIEKSFQENDYGRVTSLSVTALQSLFKEICSYKGIEVPKNSTLPQLYKKVKDALNLNPKNYTDKPEAQIFASKMDLIVKSLTEVRNLYSESHGMTSDSIFTYDSLPKHHYKLIVDSTKTIVNFYVDTFNFQNKQLKI